MLNLLLISLDNINLFGWITKTDATQGAPSDDKTSFAPVSFPLIGLTQLCQFYILIKTWNLSLNEISKHVGVYAGHSQGIISAIAAASHAESHESMLTNVRILIYSYPPNMNSFDFGVAKRNFHFYPLAYDTFCILNII